MSYQRLNMDETKEYALQQDEKDELRHLRDEFLIPSKADLKRETLLKSGKPRRHFMLYDFGGVAWDEEDRQLDKAL